MTKYILLRVVYLFLTAFAVLTIVFFALRVLPGDPVYAVLGGEAPPEIVEQTRHELGFDRPLYEQFAIYLSSFIQGDLGVSLQSKRPVAEMIAMMLPHTVLLALAAIATGLIIGVPLGVMAAVKRNGWFDSLSRIIGVSFIATPPFFVAIILLLVFGFWIGAFPIVGAGEWNQPWDILHALILPALALGIPKAAHMMRFTRSYMLEVLNEDYIRTARAKGLRERVVVFTHALKNALIPVVTILGNQLGQVIGGAVLIETVFTRPGMGRLVVEAISGRDFPVVQGTIVVFSFFVATSNMLVDLAYGLIDPRVRYR
ncbi:MAG: ABC transporter permease [Chloroflexi bacterium]|nr:ABC transporter permease [Chloroflexota bacterium]